MEAALVILLLVLSSRGTATTPQQDTGAASGAPPTPTTGNGGGEKDALTGAVTGALGLLGTAVVAIKGAIAAGAGAAATGTAVAAGGATTAGTTAATATGTTTAAAGAAGGASSSLVGGLGATPGVIGTVGLAVAGPAIIVGIAVAFEVAAQVVKAQETEKDWQTRLHGLNANARAMCAFESAMTEKVLQARPRPPITASASLGYQGTGTTYTKTNVRDWRLDQKFLGSGIISPGWRDVYSYLPFEGDWRLWQRLRAVSLRFLAYRANYGYRLITSWNALPERATADWGLTEAKLTTQEAAFVRNDLYRVGEDDTWGPVGGLLSVPLAAGGRTMVARTSDTEISPPWRELVPFAEAEPDYSAVTPEDDKLASFMALRSAIGVLSDDPRPSPSTADRPWYAANLLSALLLPGAPPIPGLRLVNDEIWTEAEHFGVNAICVPWRVKDRLSGQWRTY